MISSVAYAEDEMLSEAKTARPFALPIRKLLAGPYARPEKRSAHAIDDTARRGRRREDVLGRDEVARVLALELALGRTDDAHVAVATLPPTDRVAFLEVRAQHAAWWSRLWLSHRRSQRLARPLNDS
jgi:hypothetical protein